MSAIKTITVTGVTFAAPNITITGTVADVTHTQATQQVTIASIPAANTAWVRSLRLSSAAIFVMRNGVNSAALYCAGMEKIAVALENLLTWAPRFSTQPSSTSIATGANATLTTVQDATDELTATFKWYRSTDGTTWVEITGASTPNDGCTYSNYTTAALTITAAVIGMDGYQYKCLATTGGGTTYSDVATLTVTGDAPTVTVDPSADSCVHASTAATFSVTATGSATLLYQWQVSINGTTGWTNLVESSLGNPGPYTDVATATLTVTPLDTSIDGYSYRCVVTNGSGTDTSAAAVLTVT